MRLVNSRTCKVLDIYLEIPASAKHAKNSVKQRKITLQRKKTVQSKVSSKVYLRQNFKANHCLSFLF